MNDDTNYIEHLDEDERFQFNEFEREELTGRLSDEVIITNIREQLAAPMINSMSSNNILSYFNERYNYITRMYCDDRELVNKCKEIRLSIYSEIYRELTKRYSIASCLDDYSDKEDFYFYVNEMYIFFVVNYKKNIVSFFKNYIFKNKKEIIKRYKNQSEKKDLMFKSLKKSMGDSEYIHLIYNLEEIIMDYISMNTSDSEVIFDLIINEDPYEITNHTIKELLINNKFESSVNEIEFISEYFKPFTIEELKFELVANIRNELFALLKGEQV